MGLGLGLGLGVGSGWELRLGLYNLPMRGSAWALALTCLVSFTGRPALAQDLQRGPVSMPDRWLQGFTRAVSGELLVYPWAYPGQAKALLTRTTTGRMRIEWEAEALPAGVSDERVTYMWHGGLASGYGAHRFSLTVNGTPCATFTSGRDASDREWTVGGARGCTLSFKTTRVGTFNELFGFMMATVPRTLVGGAPPRFAVVGEAANNSDYYMTFQEPIRSWSRATAEEARFKDGSRVVSVEVSRVGNAAPMAVRTGSETVWQGTASPGYSSTTLPVRTTGTDLSIIVDVDGTAVLSQRVVLTPVRAWEIHLLPHSHVDVGYSDPQPEVERKQWKNLRDAVELAARTRDLPREARFKWNVEGLWSVESYLRQAGEADRKAFIAAVKDGAIDLQANYTNILTGISTPEELMRWTDGARRLQKEYRIDAMPTAMHTDIPGMSWASVRALALGGVRYFSSGPNYMPGTPDGGDRIGRTLKALGDRPFWWQSPSGEERVLFWMAGRGYSWFHGLNLGQLENAGRAAFLDYLRELAVKGYAYDMVQVRYTIGGDNGPTDARLPGFVKAWNETFDTPRLVIDTVRGLFTEFERRYGASLPTYAGDMSPYWEDGAVSSAAEETLVRLAARRLQQAEAVFALRNPSGYPGPAFAEAWRAVTMWHEHTWGAADSVSQPDRKDVVDQWIYKREFAVQADRRSNELLNAARDSGVRLKANTTTFEAINTLSFARDGLVFLDARDTVGKPRVVDDAGRVLPSQRLVDGRLAVSLSDVAGLGSVRLKAIGGRPASPPTPATAERDILDNGRVRVVIDAATGDIRSLQAAAVPGVDYASSSQGLHAYRYVPGLDPATAVSPRPAHVVVEEAGPLVATLRVENEAPGARRLVRRVTLVAGDDRVWLETVIDKAAVRQKESAHLAFPFNLPAAVIRVDEGEALVTIGKDQLPGSCFDFIGAHSAVDVSSARAGIGLATQDAPLIEIGAMTDERRPDGLPRAWREKPAGGSALLAYLLNNYWHTNYKADQDGELRFRFVLQPHGAFDAAAFSRLSAGIDQPLVLSRVADSVPLTPPPFRLEDSPAVVSALRPADDGKALIARIYNPTPSPTTVRITRIWRGRVVTALAPGEKRAITTEAIELKPFGAVVLEIRRTVEDTRQSENPVSR
jgi:alpha-mannosidase